MDNAANRDGAGGTAGPASGAATRSGLRLRYLLPALIFVVIAGFFAWGLTRDPRAVPSVLIDKPMPAFDLPRIAATGLVPGESFSSTTLKGEPSLVNFFASWCVPCRVEHPILNRLARSGVKVYGISWRDKPEASAAFLRELGDPFTRAGVDLENRTGFEFGVYGVPETFVIDGDGHIRYRHAGPLSESDMQTVILPMLKALAR